MDKENNLALISLYNFSSKIDEKISLKKSLVIGIDPEVKLFRNIYNPEETIKNILIMNPKNCVINGIELQTYCVQQHLKLKESNEVEKMG